MDLNDVELYTFDSIRDASLTTGIPAQEISQACKNQNKVTRNFKWKFLESGTVSSFDVINKNSNPCTYGKQNALVYYKSSRNRWIAYTMIDGKRKTIKTCKTKEEAIAAYFEHFDKKQKES